MQSQPFYALRRDEIINDFSTHKSLRDAIKLFDDKDVIDSVHNIETLLALFSLKLDEQV